MTSKWPYPNSDTTNATINFDVGTWSGSPTITSEPKKKDGPLEWLDRRVEEVRVSL